MDSVGVAVCGVGNIGSMHIESLRSLRGCHVSGVFDIDPGRVAEVAGTNGFRACATFDELLADPDTQAVVLATPAEFHRTGVTAALAAGKHVFVEKPVATTMADARAIAAAARRSPLVVQVGFCERFNPQYIEARRLVPRLGRIQAVQSSRMAPLEFSDPSWELGALDTAVHNFDLILWLTGARPLSVTAFGARLYPDLSIPTAITTVIQFEGGMVATDHISWVSLDAHPLRKNARSRMTLFGEQGIFEVDLFSRPSSLLTLNDLSQPDTVILGGPEYYGSLKLQLEAFLRAIETNGPSPVPVEDAVRVEAIALAANESLHTRKTVLITGEAWDNYQTSLLQRPAG
jgi:predicted dehydrogenase